MNHSLLPVLMIIGIFLVSKGIYMQVKAEVAQFLISSSWQNRTLDTPPIKPWKWADTRVIAKLDVPRLKETAYVMQDDSGESLAFGPGHMPASATPSNNGHVIISGHRDSHFSFLKDIKNGDLISIENDQFAKQNYRVSELIVIDTQEQEIELLDYSKLTLITCYPFEDFIPGGPLRLVVHAEPISHAG